MKRKIYRAVAAAMVMLPIAEAMAQYSGDEALTRKLYTFSAIMRELQTNYVDSLQVDSVMDTAIQTALMMVDPYTEYYTPTDQEALATMMTGEYGGIGSYIMSRKGETYISGPFEGSPAAKAGLRPGDRLLMVDTTRVSGLPSDKVSSLLRGKPNTRVQLTVVRPYAADSVMTFDVVRELLNTPSVPYYKRFDDGTAYVALSSFIFSSQKEILSALDSLRKEGPLTGLIFDLRDNGGGLLESAVGILGNFLPKNTEVLRTRGRDAREEKVYKTTQHPHDTDLPMVVLINGNSASASEVVAGTLQDLDRAVLVGQRSFGKGLVQSTRRMPYENLLKLTVAKYYIPSGRLIQALDYSRRNPDGTVARTPDSLTNVYHTRAGREVRDGGGLTPDVVVELPDVSRLLYSLVYENWIFDYATKFAAEHPEIGPADEFVITDEIYDDFKNWIDADRFKYDKLCDDMVENLRKAAKLDGYLNDEVSAQLDTLTKMLTHDLKSDLDLKREEITDYLLPEILSRYYYERGRYAGALSHDIILDKARAILANPEEYKRLLTPQKKSEPKKSSKK